MYWKQNYFGEIDVQKVVVKHMYDRIKTHFGETFMHISVYYCSH